jgi:hypothetical protein
MCTQHVPIIVYDCGGTYKECSNCGAILSHWEQNGKPKRHPKKEKIREKNEQSVTTQV